MKAPLSGYSDVFFVVSQNPNFPQKYFCQLCKILSNYLHFCYPVSGMPTKVLDLSNIPNEPVSLDDIRAIFDTHNALSAKLTARLDASVKAILHPPKWHQDFVDKLIPRQSNVGIDYWTNFLQQYKAREVAVQRLTDAFFTWHPRVSPVQTPTIEQKQITKVADRIIDLAQDHVTEANEENAGRRYFLLDANGYLVDKKDPSMKRYLFPYHQRIITRLERKFCKTIVLKNYSKYKTEESTREGIRKLNDIGMEFFKLPTKIAVGQKEAGYRLARYIYIQIHKENPYR